MAMFLASKASAQTLRTWDDGSTAGSWSQANNWSSNDIPDGTGEGAAFGGTDVTISQNQGNPLTLGHIQFLSGSAARTISGNAITLNAGSFTNLGIVHRDDSLMTISAPLNVGSAGQTWRTASTGALTISGAVDLNANTLTLDASTGTITISSVISDTGSVIKSGTGTVQFSGGSANTFSGTTTVQNGVLELNKTAGVNAIAGAITVGDGSGGASTAELKLLAANQITNAATVTLVTPDGYFNLNGFSETVASVGGTGTIQLGANGVLTVDHTTSVSFTGVIGGSGTAGLTKNGTGTWTLGGSAANTYTGATTVNEGQLTLSKSSGVAVSGSALNIGDGSGTSAVVQLTAANQIADSTTITLLSDGRLDLNGQSDTVGIINITAGAGHDAISLGAGTLTMNGDMTVNSSVNTAIISGSGSLNLGTTERRLNVVGGASFPNPDLQINTPISGSVGLTKNGSGSLYLVAASPSFSGPYTNNAGLVGIGTSTSFGTGTVYVNGGGLVAGVGSLTLANNVTVGGNFGIGGYDLVMSGGISLGGSTRTISVTNNNNTMSGVVSNGGLTKDGFGTLIFSGGSANTYTGATTVNLGELDLGKSSGLAIAGTANVTVGTGSGAGATLELLASQQINDSAPLIVNADGTFNLNGFNETLGIITLNGGSIVGSGTLTMGGDLATTVATNAVISASALNLGGSTRIFNVGGTSLTISSVISNGGVTKSGSGTLILSAANTFTGPLTINAGTVQLTTSDRIDNSVDVTIAAGATFDLNGQNESIRALTMAGGVVQGSPSTLTLGGDVRYNGTTTSASITTSYLSLGSSSPRTFNIDNGSQAIDMDVTSAVSGSVQLVKSGDGAIRFSNSANNWTLGTALNGGSIVMADKGALGTGALTMANGTTLELTYTDGANADLAGITMNGTSTILRTASAGAKSGLLNSGTLTVNGTATLTDQGGDAGVDSALIVDGPVVINNGGKLVMNASGVNDEVRLGGSSSITIAGGGELQTTGSGTKWIGKSSGRTIIGQGSGSGSNAGAFSEAKLTLGANTSFNASTAIQMSGSGQAGLMVTGSPTDVSTFLSSRIPTAGSGTITVVHTGSATNTIGALQPASGSALMLGFGRANATDTPGYTLNSAIPNWAGLVIKGGTTRASVDQSFVGAGSSSFYIYDDIYGADAAARKANSVLTFLGNRTLSFNGNGYFYGGTINGNTGGGNQGTLVFTGSIVSEGTTLAGYPNITMNNATPQSVSGSTPLTGVGTFIKTGAGTLTLSVGITTVAGGGGIQIQQGSLTLGADNVINDTGSSMQLSTGVTFNSNGKLATLGTLSLSGQATVDLGSGTSVLHFQNTSAITWGTGTGLTINNWTGAAGGGGTDQLYFGSGSSGLTSGQLSKIIFVNPAGFAAGLYSAKILPTGEVVPLAIIPEPTTVATMGLLGLALAWRERQRWLRRRAGTAPAKSDG